MAHSIGLMETGCTSKISQISGFQNHLPKNLTCLFLSLRANLKKTVCHDWPCIGKGKMPDIPKQLNINLVQLLLCRQIPIIKTNIFRVRNSEGQSLYCQMHFKNKTFSRIINCPSLGEKISEEVVIYRDKTF